MHAEGRQPGKRRREIAVPVGEKARELVDSGDRRVPRNPSEAFGTPGTMGRDALRPARCPMSRRERELPFP